MIVPDASAIVAVLLDSEPQAEFIRVRIEHPGQSLHVPHFLDLEVIQTLRRHALRGVLMPDRSTEALTDFADIKFTRYPHTSFIERIWELKENVTAYDAAYIALAETLDAPLITTDGRLARAPGHHAEVELYE